MQDYNADDIFKSIDTINKNIEALESSSSSFRDVSANAVNIVSGCTNFLSERGEHGGTTLNTYNLLTTANLLFSQIIFDNVIRLSPHYFSKLIDLEELELKVRNAILDIPASRNWIDKVSLELIPLSEAVGRGCFQKGSYLATLTGIVTISGKGNSTKTIIAFALAVSWDFGKIITRAITVTEIIFDDLFGDRIKQSVKMEFDKQLYHEMGGNRLFPIINFMEFPDPLHSEKVLPLFDIHISTSPLLVGQYHNRRQPKRELDKLPQIERQILFALDKSALDRYVVTAAQPILESAKQQNGQLKKSDIYEIPFGPSPPLLFILVYIRAEKEEGPCTGYAEAYLRFGVNNKKEDEGRLKLVCDYLGAENIKSDVDGGDLCEAAGDAVDVINNWKKEARKKIEETTFQSETLIDQRIEGARRIFVWSESPYFCIAFDKFFVLNNRRIQ